MKWASQFVRRAALVANILFVGVAAVWISEILSWEGGLQPSVVLAVVVAGYVSSNGGALLVTSRRGRILWTIPAVLANLAFAYSAVCIVGEVAGNFIAAQAFYACIILVAINSLGIVSKGRLSPRRPQTVAELVPSRSGNGD
jgi:hypothetical protein